MNVVFEYKVEAKMRDGTVLRANVFRPAGDDEYPVLLTRLPYGKDMVGANAAIDSLVAARAGYIVVVQDCRGRFQSDGSFQSYVQEFEDGYDTVEWAAGLPQSNGDVGMFGASYYGFTQWAAAARCAPSLKALFPSITYDDPWNGSSVRGGAFEWGKSASWYMSAIAPSEWMRESRKESGQAFDPDAWRGLFADIDRLATDGYWTLPLTDFAPLRDRGMLPMFFHQFEHPTYDEYWRKLSITAQDQGAHLPSFNLGGWYDIFLQGTIDNYLRMKQRGVKTQLLIGPWSHVNRSGAVGDLVFGSAANGAFLDLREDMTTLHLRWFDHVLKGKKTGIEADGPVKIFVMGDNRWRVEPDWPLPQTAYTPLYLGGRGFDKAGQLAFDAPADDAPDAYQYDPADPVPTLGGNLLMPPQYPPGPLCQRPIEGRPDVLVFTSQELEQDLEVTGPVEAVLWVQSDAPDTDFVVRMTDVHPDGQSILICDGIVRMSLRNSIEEKQLLRADEVAKIRVSLWATSNVFKQGHRIRVHVTSSSFPRWNRNLNTGDSNETTSAYQVANQRVYHDAEHPSHILLPVIARGH